MNTVRLGLLALVWGSGFLWIELALREGWDPVHITVARSALGAVLLVSICVALQRRFPRDARTLAKLTLAALLCNTLPFAFISFGQQTLDSGLAGVLNATTPLFALLLTRDFDRRKTFGVVTGFAGVLFIFSPWDAGRPSSVGALAMLAAAASYAAGFAYMARKLVGRGTDTLTLAGVQLALAAVLSTALLPFAPGLGRPTVLSTTAVLVLGIACTGFTFYLSYRLIAAEGATNTAVVGYLLPVVAVGLGAIVLGEPITARTVLGMVVVLAGVAFTRDWGHMRPQRFRPAEDEHVRPAEDRAASEAR